MTISLTGYYNRFDASDRYDAHLFLPDRVLQSAELNEIQSVFDDRVARIANALFADGAVMSGCAIQVDQNTGETRVQSGVLYLLGAMRGIAPADLVVAVSGTVVVGAWLVETVITETQDPSLRDPAISMLNFGEPGAARLQREASWGLSTDVMPADARFYPIYTIIDGAVLPIEPPPQIETVALAVARYDVQSTGGYYISTGMRVNWLPDTAGGAQQFSIDEGTARINGREITALHAIRVTYDPDPDLDHVDLEIHNATTSPQRIDVYHAPLASVTQVLATLQDTTTITKGTAGGADEVRKSGQLITGITSLVSISQGGTTYTPTTDYLLTADHVDWSPAGSEPSTGSTYTVVYRYIAEVTPSAIDDDGFTVAGAVTGTQILCEYDWKLPRIDRICLAATGVPQVIAGIPQASSPVPPRSPAGVLSLAVVYQTWRAETRFLRNDGVRMVPMEDLDTIKEQIIDLYSLVGDERLKNNANAMVPAAKRGLFVDGFFDDSMRDDGLTQTAAVHTDLNMLTLGVDQQIEWVDLGSAQTLTASSERPVVTQLMGTGSMLINPYMVFEPLPGTAELSPRSDFWTEFRTTWRSPVIIRIIMPRPTYLPPDHPHGWYIPKRTQEIIVRQTGTTVTEVAYLRQIEVRFTLRHFGGGETLNAVIFDGQAVAFSAP